MPRLLVRINANGYKEFFDRASGEWVPVHRRVAEKKFGELRPGFQVHHRNQKKGDNRNSNLLEAHPKVHGRLHSHPDACVRCGREGHWAASCRFKTFWDGTRLVE